MKKCFIILEFGKPFEWTQKYIDHVQHLEKYGWYWKIFTPNAYESKGNVEVVPMTMDQFNDLVGKKLGVRPSLSLLPKGIPNFHISDLFVMCGVIFEDYLKDFDFWGTIGLDCVVGRLDHFVPDSELELSDVWTDDIGQFNANFALWRNTPEINNLFKEIGQWEDAVLQGDCPGCTNGGTHFLWATDELFMSKILESKTDIRYCQPPYYLIHGHDRLEIHKPKAKLEIKDDGSLWELIADTEPGGGRRHPLFGREIAYYHFSSTKEWPLI
jgi:hypothetical protein